MSRRPALRRFSFVALFTSLAFLLGALTLVAANAFLAANADGKLLNGIIGDNFPGVKIDYAHANLRFSLTGGAHVRALALTVTYNEKTLLEVSQADFFLDNDKLHIVLLSPQAHIPSLVGGVGAVSNISDNAKWKHNLLLSASNARLTFADTPLTLQSTDIALRRDENGWHLNLLEEQGFFLRANVTVNHNGQGRLAAEFIGTPPLEELKTQHVNLTVWVDIKDHITAAAIGLWQPPAEAQSVAINAINLPAVNVSFAIVGDVDYDKNWQLKKAQLQLFDDSITANINAAAAGNQNGVTIAGGVARLADAPAAALIQHLPKDASQWADDWNSEAITFNIAAGGLWRGDNDEWSVGNAHLRLFNNDIHITAVITANGSNSTLHIAQAAGQFNALPLIAISTYLPNGEVRDWFAFALKDGVMTDGKFFLQTDGGENKQDTIRLTAAFSEGVVNIDDGWPQARALAGAIVINNDDIHIDGEGVFGKIAVTNVIARIPHSSGERATLFLDMHAAPASIAEHLDTANQIPFIKTAVQNATRDFSLHGGRAALSVFLALPLASPADAAASARLQVRHAGVEIPDFASLTGIGGEILIDNNNIRGRLRGRLVNEDPLKAPILNIDFFNDEATISGNADIAVILSAANAPPLPVSGETDFRLMRSPTVTVFTSPLTGIFVDLPHPIGGNPDGISIHFGNDEMRALYRNNNHTLRLQTTTGDSGNLVINDNLPPLPDTERAPTAGWNIYGNASDIDLDSWLDLPDGNSLTLAEIMLTLTNATLFNNDNSTLIINSPAPKKETRELQLHSANIDGTLQISNDKFSGRLSQVRLTTWPSTNSKDDSNKILSFIIATLVIPGDITVGAVDVFGKPSGTDWKLSRFQIRNGDSRLNLSGISDGDNTSLSLTLDAPTLPDFLALFHLNDFAAAGQLIVNGNIGWPGAMADFDLNTLTGALLLNAEDLRYLNSSSVGTGLINFLAIFSPQSLVSLGFVDVVESGIIFTTVSGDISLANGVATITEEIDLISKDLLVNIRGGTNYISRRHNLYGKVRPGQKLLDAGSALGAGAVAAGIIAVQPLSILALPLFNELLDEPISELGAYEYTITGEWANPIYEETETNTETNIDDEAEAVEEN